MNGDDFIALCKDVVVEQYYTNDTDTKITNASDVYVVWSCKTLQNNKALVSTTVNDGMYYELTYNGDKKEMYVDAYKKCDNRVIK